MKNKLSKKSGYMLLETIFYILLFAILSIVVINALITMAGSFKETTVQAELIQGGDILEKMTREIRQAYSINTISTTSLKLNVKDISGTNKTVEFLLSGSDIHFLENEVSLGNLNSDSILIENLSFSQINTTKSVAIKISFSVRSTHDSQNRTEYFYNTVVLRGDYH